MTTLKVGTLNLRGWLDRWLKRRHLVVANILDERPDLLSLQEIYMPLRQGHWLRHELNSRLGRREYSFVQKRKQHPWNGLYEGIGILSRLPIIAADHVALGYGGRVALRANVELPTGQPLDFIAAHLHHIPDEQAARLEQAMAMVGWLDGTVTSPLHIVAGDLNEVPSGPALSYLKQRYQSAMELARGMEPAGTFPTALVQDPPPVARCLDYILLSPELRSVLWRRYQKPTPRAASNENAPVADRGVSRQSLFPADPVPGNP